MYGRRIKSSEESARTWASVLFYTIRISGLLLLFYFISLLLLRPVFVSLFVSVFTSLWHYLTRADSFWHQSQQLENQFWMLVTFISCATLVFAPDSPYAASSTVSYMLGWVFTLSFTTAAHFIDKHHHRNRLKDIPVFLPYPIVESSTAEGKVEVLQELTSQLDRTLPSTFHTMWNIGKYVHIERQILSIFSDCSKEELNYVIAKVEMKLIAYKLKNHNKSSKSSLDLTQVVGAYSRLNRSRSGLMDILAVRRVSDLNLAARAIVLDVVQSLRMIFHPDTEKEAQEWVKNLLVTVKGDTLSELKQLVDNKGSAESMHKLVHVDIRSEEIRKRILDHFNKQASIQAAQMAMGSKVARKRLLRGAWRKVLSDVDDTLFSSGGRYPAGIDQSYKRKVFYPAVTAFYKELGLGTIGPDAERGVWPPNRFGDLVFLSARPHVYKDLTETGMYSKFRKFMKTQGLHCMPSLLPGDLESGQAFMMQGDFLPMALKKMKNFEEYYSIYPEYTHVFIGDNGQADVKAAEFMVEKFGSDKVERVYVHEVQPRQFTYGYEPSVSDQKWEKMGIVFCKTYVGAALDAARCKLILDKGLQRVAVAARQEFNKIKHTWKNIYVRETRRVEMNKDIQLANEYLLSKKLTRVLLIEGESYFPVGMKVYTGFGKGFIKSYRPSDGMYEIVLDWKYGACCPPKLFTLLYGVFPSRKALKESQKQLFTAHTEEVRVRTATFEDDKQLLSSSNSQGLFPAEPEHVTEEDLRETASPRLVPTQVVSDFPFGVITPVITYGGERPPEPVRRKRTETLMDDKPLTSAVEDVLDIGTKVSTPYGTGVVLQFRNVDNIYEIALLDIAASGYIAEVSLILWNSDLFQNKAESMVREGSYPRRLFGLMKNLFTRETSIQDTLFTVDTIVKTPYGQGSVLAYREEDDMYVIRLIWGAKSYIPRSSGHVLFDDDFEHIEDPAVVEEMVKKDSSPLQRARELVAKNWAMFKLPFSVLGGNSATPKNALPTSESLLSLSSLVSANSTGSNSSFFSTAEEHLGDIWNLQKGDRVDTNSFGVGTLVEIRDDGFFEIKLPYGIAYINVPRVLQIDDHMIYKPSTRVITEYGMGFVKSYRTEDGVYCIQLERWNAQVYICTRRKKVRSLSGGKGLLGETSSSSSKSSILEEIDQAGQGGSDSSFKSSILSFISNIIQPKSKDVEEQENMLLEKKKLEEIVGHTEFSWRGDEEEGIRVPIGHTEFSWRASLLQ